MKSICSSAQPKCVEGWVSVSDKGGLGPIDRRDPFYWVGSRGDLSGDWQDRVPRTGFVDDVSEVFAEAINILIGRHADYGPDNVNNGFPSPLVALVTRMTDKMERIKHLLVKGGDTYGERMRDSWIDLANYALIGVMVQDGTWPGISAHNQLKPLSKESNEPLGGNP